MVPGVAGIATVDHNHRVLGRRTTVAHGEDTARGTHLLGNIEGSVIRQDLEEAVAMVGLDFKVDLLINQRREVVQVFAGQFVEQHRAGVATAQKLYATPMAGDCDVVVTNTYPIENQAVKGIWPPDLSLKEGGRRRGDLRERRGTGAALSGRPLRHRLRRQPLVAGRAVPDPEGGQVLVCSRYQSRTDLDVYGPGGNVVSCANWSEVLIQLTTRFPQGAKAAIYPYAAIQLPA